MRTLLRPIVAVRYVPTRVWVSAAVSLLLLAVPPPAIGVGACPLSVGIDPLPLLDLKGFEVRVEDGGGGDVDASFDGVCEFAVTLCVADPAPPGAVCDVNDNELASLTVRTRWGPGHDLGDRVEASLLRPYVAVDGVTVAGKGNTLKFAPGEQPPSGCSVATFELPAERDLNPQSKFQIKVYGRTPTGPRRQRVLVRCVAPAGDVPGPPVCSTGSQPCLGDDPLPGSTTTTTRVPPASTSTTTRFTIPNTTTSTWTGSTLSTSTTLLAGVNDYYVAPSGRDTNNGSRTAPWATIQHADAALSLGARGTIVHVAPGRYWGHIRTTRAGTQTQPIRFVSDGKWAARINGFWSVQGPYQSIENFEITCPGCSRAIACYVGQTSGRAHHCRILGNYIHDIGTTFCDSAGAVNTAVVASGTAPRTDAERGYNVVSGNVIRHVGADAGAPYNCNQFHGIYLGGPRDVAQNNIVSGVIGWGIHARGDVTHQVISNNTVFNNGKGGLILQATGPTYDSYDYGTITNNVVVNNGRADGTPFYGIVDYNRVIGTHNVFRGNLLYGNLPANWGKGLTTTYGSPICPDPCEDTNMQTGSDATTFANYWSDWNTAPARRYSASDYAPRAGSTAIDRGTTACTVGVAKPCAPAQDFTGTPRPQGAAHDIGAFEVRR